MPQPISSAGLPEYRNLPVIEIACGLRFYPLQIPVLQLGLLWETLREEYPTTAEMPLLAPVQKPSELLSALPLPRLWFVSQDDARIVQIQNDAFFVNWRKTSDSAPTPEFGKTRELFSSQLGQFEKFLSDRELGRIVVSQYELTYILHVPQEKEQVGSVFPDFSWRDTAFELGAFNWHTRFAHPATTGYLVAKISSAHLQETGEDILRLEMGAVGPAEAASNQPVGEWLDGACRAIMLSIAHFVNEGVQKERWGRLK
ncbi:MAG: TIGR04255 family protein [Deltaproteobacteria bacterium]|nr:TIGR04255 family protein [Deltaproteobacteria bacterium]